MMRRPLNHVSIVGAFLFLAACAPATPQAPDTPHSIAGRVTAVTPVSGGGWGSLRVEERPAGASGSAKASVRLERSAQIIRGEEVVGFDALQVGQWVRVWFTGPVAASYPVQAMGRAVAIVSLPR